MQLRVVALLVLSLACAPAREPAADTVTDTAVAAAQPAPPRTPERTTAAAAPRFEDYPAGERFAGRPVPIDFARDPDARQFRTRLTWRPGDTVNFAGRFRVVMWGCGTECQDGAVVDAATGRVHSLPEALSVGADFRVDSRLFVANPPEAIRAVHGEAPPDYVRTKYYRWADTGFVALDPAARR